MAVTGQAGLFVRELGPLQQIPLLIPGKGGRSASVVLQEGEKPRNDVADKMGQLVERWEQSISSTNRRFGARFLAGEIHILIVFRIIETNEVWFVCLERCSSDNHILANGQDETVLVSVVESAEKPEGLTSAFVWLERINGLNRFPPRTLYASSLSGFITLQGMKYRELNIFPYFGGDFVKRNANRDQMKDKMVESASQVVNNISSDCGNLGRIDIERPEIKRWLPSLHLRIEANQLKGCFAKRLDSHFEIVEVLLGPFNFYKNQSESVVGCHGHY